VIRTKTYITQIEDGQLKPAAQPQVARRTGAIALVDCGFGFGQIGARFGAQLASDIAQENGIGCVALQDVNHIGRLGEYAEMIARDGMVGLLFTGGTMGKRSVTPYGGREAIMGTNPMAWAVPTGDMPLIHDVATAAVANGKIMVALSKGEAFPDGMLLDKDGVATTDPASFYEGGMLLPFGTYKGSGLAMMMELIPTLLAGFAPIALPGFRSGNPTLILALQVEAFTDRANFEQNVRDFMARVKTVPPAVGFDEAMLPGEQEARYYADRSRHGIPLPEAVWDDLTTLATRYDVALPQVQEP
jgi:uncharacterized oxidoreductase